MGQSIDGDLHCSSEIDPGGPMTASCTGVTETGVDVSGAFSGTADVEEEECAAALSISVGGEVVVTQPEVACFNT